MSITSCFGIFILFFLPDIPAPTFENVEVKEVSYYETLSLLKNSNKMRLMCPIIYYNGMCLSFMMSEFMKFVAGRMLGVENSGYIISSFYCANALCIYSYYYLLYLYYYFSLFFLWKISWNNDRKNWISIYFIYYVFIVLYTYFNIW